MNAGITRLLDASPVAGPTDFWFRNITPNSKPSRMERDMPLQRSAHVVCESLRSRPLSWLRMASGKPSPKGRHPRVNNSPQTSTIYCWLSVPTYLLKNA